MTDKKEPTGEYKVGYCKPPEAARLKPGRCGNPYGRKGKPENREAIAERKKGMSMQETLDKVGSSRRAVRTAGGGAKRMQNLEVLLEVAMQGAIKDPALALKVIELFRKHEQVAAREPDRPACGVTVIQQPAATMEQSLTRARARQEELRAAGSLYAAQRQLPGDNEILLSPQASAPTPKRNVLMAQAAW